MPRTLVIVERNADRFGNVSFIMQGKFEELAPMGLTEKPVVIEQGNSRIETSIIDATVRASVLTLRFSGPEAAKLTRGAKVVIA